MPLSSFLATAAAALCAVAASPALADDYFAVSGGGARAAIVGLAAIREFELRDAMVSVDKTMGLSGGSWAVLINEAIGAKEALERYSKWTSKGNMIGKDWSGFLPGLDQSNVWMHIATWEGYVDSVVRHPLSLPSKPFKYKQDGKARVLIGASVQTPRGNHPGVLSPKGGGGTIVFPNCVASFTGFQGTNAVAGNLGCTPTRKDLFIGLGGVKLDPVTLAHAGPISFTREVQATASSLAWLFGRMGLAPRHLKSGMPVHMHMQSEESGSRGRFDLAMWDLGIAANLPSLPTELDERGVTVIVDASADTKLGASLEQTREWWKSAFRRETRPSEDTSFEWNGKTWSTASLGPYAEFVRVFDVYEMGLGVVPARKTGRKIVALLMGAIDLETGKIMNDEERLKDIETIKANFDATEAAKDVAQFGLGVGGAKALHRSVKDGVFDPKVFGKDGFDKMTGAIRTFYSRVLTAMLPKARTVVDGSPLGASVSSH